MVIGTTKQGDNVCRSCFVDFLVLDLPLPYNAIIGQHTQTEFHIYCDVRSLTLLFGTNSGDAYIYVS